MKRLYVAAASIAVIGVICIGASNPALAHSSPAVTVGPEMARAIKDGVRRDLKDPDSARFSNLRAFREPDGTITACGYVNARNSYGGYTGDVPFAISVLTGKQIDSGAPALFAHGTMMAELSDDGLRRFYRMFPNCGTN